MERCQKKLPSTTSHTTYFLETLHMLNGVHTNESLISPLNVLSKSAASLNPADFKFLVKSSSLEMGKFKLILWSNNVLIEKELSRPVILMGAFFRNWISSSKNIFILNFRAGKESIFIPGPIAT